MNLHDKHVYMARVFLAQARHSRRHPSWHATLLYWASMRRRRAAGEPVLGSGAHEQGELFEPVEVNDHGKRQLDSRRDIEARRAEKIDGRGQECNDTGQKTRHRREKEGGDGPACPASADFEGF